MKSFIGTSIILLALALGLYVGLWVFFIGGIIDIVESTRAEAISGVGIGIGVIKMFFSVFAGGLTAVLTVLLGGFIFKLG